MKVVMAIPPGGAFLSTNWMSSPPLGLSYCAAVLERENHNVTIIDAFAEGLNYDKLVKRVCSVRPDIVGVYFMTDNRLRAFRTIREIKMALPEVNIIAGGPHPTLTADDTLRNITELDFIVRGEGEKVMPRLLRVLENGSLPEGLEGVSFRKDGEVFHNPDSELIADLDTIPFPAIHLLPLNKYNYHLNVPGKGKMKAIFILNSRGCPFRCIFCSNTLLWGNKYRNRSPENFVDEIEFDIKEYGLRAFTFADDTFNNNRENIFEICDLILKRGLKFSWNCQIRVDNVNREMVFKMKEAGCFAIGYGVESGRQRIIDEVIGKGITLEQVYNVLKISKEAEILNFPNFMLGFPSETREDALETARFIKKISRPGVYPILTLTKIYPGTKIEKIALEYGIIDSDFSWADEEYAAKAKDTLPTVLGFIPIFRDKLSWIEIGEILFQWGETRSDLINVWQIAFSALKGVRRFEDIKRLFLLWLAYLKVKSKKIISLLKKEDSKTLI